MSLCVLKIQWHCRQLTTFRQSQFQTINRRTFSARCSLVLGIESSCDDTGVAVVRSDGVVLGQKVVGQCEIHEEWGGIVPKLAEEAHQQVIDETVEDVMKQAQISCKQLDGIAVTVGPGLALCLLVGVRKAAEMSICSARNDIAWLPVHHMEAHALVVRQQSQVDFPYLCLLVSGGHNLLLIVQGVGEYVQLGTTQDDAMGEAFDKIARLLGLKLYPSGGAALEQFAVGGDDQKFKFTVPMKRKLHCDFSFAGLKTAVRRQIDTCINGDFSAATLQVRQDLAASFQRVAVEHLGDKLTRAISWIKETHPEISALVVSGGVASNKLVRKTLDEVAQEGGLKLVCPPPSLCTDNGVMVGWAGQERLALGMKEKVPSFDGSPDDFWFDLKPRWPLTNQKHPFCEEKKIVLSMKSRGMCESLTEMTKLQKRVV